MYHAISCEKFRWDLRFLWGFYFFNFFVGGAPPHSFRPRQQSTKGTKLAPDFHIPGFSIHPPPKSKVNKKELSRVHTSFVHSN